MTQTYDRVCFSCAGKQSDGCLFPEYKPRGQRRLCWDCTIEERRKREPADPSPKVQTRAGYRAAKRWRDSQPQTDLVDMVVPCP
jgi:hypothetical protein